MKIINFNDIAYLPHFNLEFNMLDFENVECDDESIFIPFKSEISNNLYFEHIKEILQNQIRNFYQDEDWKDDEIEGKYSFIIWKNDDCSYTFKIQFLTNDNCCDTYLCVDLNTDERKILKPIMDKVFVEADDFAEIRLQVARTFAGNISKSVLSKLKLNSEKILGNSYRSAWITDDNQRCVVANVEDCSKSDCPVEIVKFWC